MFTGARYWFYPEPDDFNSYPSWLFFQGPVLYYRYKMTRSIKLQTQMLPALSGRG